MWRCFCAFCAQFAYNLSAPLDAKQAGRYAIMNGERVGFVLASVLRNHADVAPSELGWLDRAVVVPEYQKRGVGRGLLDWAEEWLTSEGKTRIRLGGGLRPFAPGVAAEWNTAFFRSHGFVPRPQDPVVQDFGQDLKDVSHHSFLRAPQTWCVVPPRKTIRMPWLDSWCVSFRVVDGPRIRTTSSAMGALISDSICFWKARRHRCVLRDDVRGFGASVENHYPAPSPRPWGQVARLGERKRPAERGICNCAD